MTKGEAKVKNRILVLVVILTFGCVVMVILSGQKLAKNQSELDKERYTRIVAEEKLSQTLSKLSSLESELSKKQNQIENVQVILEKEKNSVFEIKGQMDKLMQVNRQLEETLKTVVPSPSVASSVPAADGPSQK